MIEDKEIRPTDQTRWDLYVQQVGEPRRFEDWKSQVVIIGALALLAVGGGVSLWLFLTGRVG